MFPSSDHGWTSHCVALVRHWYNHPKLHVRELCVQYRNIHRTNPQKKPLSKFLPMPHSVSPSRNSSGPILSPRRGEKVTQSPPPPLPLQDLSGRREIWLTRTPSRIPFIFREESPSENPGHLPGRDAGDHFPGCCNTHGNGDCILRGEWGELDYENWNVLGRMAYLRTWVGDLNQYSCIRFINSRFHSSCLIFCYGTTKRTSRTIVRITLKNQNLS